MFNLRKRVLAKLDPALLKLGTFFVRAGGSGLKLREYRIERLGWIWFVFPRFALVHVRDIDLSKPIRSEEMTAQHKLHEIATSSTEEIRAAVSRSSKNRSGRVKTRLQSSLHDLVLGTEKLPTALVTQGKASAQDVHRAIVQAAGNAAAKKYTEVVRKTLAQLLLYAREEAGGTPVNPPALPIGTRFVFYGDPHTMYVIEESPRVRTVLWDEEKVQLSFPYVIFIVYLKNGQFEVVQMFFRSEPLRSIKDELYSPHLPDIMESHYEEPYKSQLRRRFWVCFPGPKITKGDPTGIAHSVQQVFWGSEFRSNHWHRSLREKVEKVPGFSVQRWIEKSRTDPLAAMKFSWLKTPYTVEILAADLKKREGAPVRESLSRLEKYLQELEERVSTAIQEAVVEAITDSNGPTAARHAFEAKIRASLEGMNLASEAARLIREQIDESCADEAIDTIVATVAKKAAIRVGEVITPALDAACVAAEQTLNQQRKGE